MQGKRIVFLGTHGQFNIGDELLLETFLAQLGTENQYYVNSYDPAFTARQLSPRFRAEVFHTAAERGRFLRYLLGCDLLFFGGGSIIKELYASVGRSRYATLLMVLATVTFTRRIARKPIVMSNIGVGPISTPWGRRLARWILRQVDVLSVRDEKSYQTCLSLGLEPDPSTALSPSTTLRAGRVRRAPDAVFVNPAKVFREDEARPVAGISPRSSSRDEPAQGGTLLEGASAVSRLRIALNLNYDIENPANWETFQANLADALKTLHARQPLELHALPMQSRFKAEHDYKVLAEFRPRIPDIPMILHRPETHREAAAIIAACDLLVSERLHAIVIAAILGVPCFALMYDTKVRELVAGLGIEAYAVDVNRPFYPETVAHGLATLVENAADVRAHLLARSAALRAALNAYFAELERLLTRRL